MRFMFQLTKEEYIYSQKEIDAIKMGARKCSYVFTEQGISQLSAVLHSDVAVERFDNQRGVTVCDTLGIHMRAFVAMRRFITANVGALYHHQDRLFAGDGSGDAEIDDGQCFWDRKLSRTRIAAFWCTDRKIQVSRTRKAAFWCTGECEENKSDRGELTCTDFLKLTGYECQCFAAFFAVKPNKADDHCGY